MKCFIFIKRDVNENVLAHIALKYIGDGGNWGLKRNINCARFFLFQSNAAQGNSSTAVIGRHAHLYCTVTASKNKDGKSVNLDLCFGGQCVHSVRSVNKELYCFGLCRAQNLVFCTNSVQLEAFVLTFVIGEEQSEITT